MPAVSPLSLVAMGKPVKKTAKKPATKPATAKSPKGKHQPTPEGPSSKSKPAPSPDATAGPIQRTVVWRQRVIGDDDTGDQPLHTASQFTIVDDQMDNGCEQNEAEAESFAYKGKIDAVEAQAQVEGTLEDAVWLSDAKEDELMASVYEVSEDLVSKCNRVQRENEIRRHLAAEAAKLHQADADGEGEEGAAAEEDAEGDALLQEMLIEQMVYSPNKAAKASSSSAITHALPCVLPEETSYADEAALQVVRSGQAAEAKLKLYDIFPSMEAGDIAVRACGAQSSPFRLLQGGRRTKRVYVCSHKSHSGFKVLGKRKQGDGARGGNHMGKDQMRDLLDAVPHGKCSGFVELTSVRAGALVDYSWRK